MLGLIEVANRAFQEMKNANGSGFKNHKLGDQRYEER